MQNIEHSPVALKVALVASDGALRSSIRLLLDVSGMAVHEFRTAREFLASGPAANDCLVIDCQLTDMGVYRFCMEAVRHHEQAPIIMLAASPESFEFVKLTHPNVRVVSKPFEGDLLIDTIIDSVGAGPNNGSGDRPPQDALSAAS